MSGMYRQCASRDIPCELFRLADSPEQHENSAGGLSLDGLRRFELVTVFFVALRLVSVEVQYAMQVHLRRGSPLCVQSTLALSFSQAFAAEAASAIALLTPFDLTVMHNFERPPPLVLMVMSCLLTLKAPAG